MRNRVIGIVNLSSFIIYCNMIYLLEENLIEYFIVVIFVRRNIIGINVRKYFLLLGILVFSSFSKRKLGRMLGLLIIDIRHGKGNTNWRNLTGLSTGIRIICWIDCRKEYCIWGNRLSWGWTPGRWIVHTIGHCTYLNKTWPNSRSSGTIRSDKENHQWWIWWYLNDSVWIQWVWKFWCLKFLNNNIFFKTLRHIEDLRMEADNDFINLSKMLIYSIFELWLVEII